MLERIISSCVNGSERAALEVGELFGLLTGGQTRRGINLTSDERRFGLEAKSCSRLEALLANANRSDGTLAFGPVSKPLAQQLEPFGHVFSVQRFLSQTSRYVSDWIDRFGIRTLNIVGEPTDNWALVVRQVMLELLARQGYRALLPMQDGCKVVVDAKGVHAVRLWRTPRAWTWRGGQIGWKPVRKWTWICNRQDLWSGGWFKPLLPENVREIVSPDGLCLDCAMLKLVARLGQPALDLARAGRWALLRMLAEPSHFVDVPVGRRVVRQLARARQRDLIGAFGFPATESAVRTLAKVSHSLPLWMLERLRGMLADADTAATIRHLPRINDSVMHLLCDPFAWRWVAPPCLNELCRSDGLLGHSELDRFHAEVQRTRILPRAGSVRSVQELWDLLDKLKTAPTVFNGPLPSVSFELPGLIEPLTTKRQLREEGYQMRHCVGKFWEDVRDGLARVFRILPDPGIGNGRATLMLLSINCGERWRIYQISGEANKQVSSVTERLVESWLKHAMASPEYSSRELREHSVADLSSHAVGCTAA